MRLRGVAALSGGIRSFTASVSGTDFAPVHVSSEGDPRRIEPCL